MNKRFRVKAFYQVTKRRRTVTIVARNEVDVVDLLRNSGFLEPFEIEEDVPECPTEAQLRFVKTLNIIIPTGASKEDVSAIIHKKTEGDSDPRPDLLEYAYDKGLFVSQYVSKKALYNFIYNNLIIEDRIAFFSFSIYRWLSEDRQSNLHRHKYKEMFYEFAKQQLTNDKFLKSLDKYGGSDLRFFGTLKFSDGGSARGSRTDTTAYKTCAEFLNLKLGIPNAEIKMIDSVTRKIVVGTNHKVIDNRVERRIEESKSGCLGMILLLAIFALFIGAFFRLISLY